MKLKGLSNLVIVIGAISIVIIGIAFYFTSIPKLQNVQGMPVVTVIVIDEDTQEPIEGALVELRQQLGCLLVVGAYCPEGYVVREKTNRDGKAIFYDNMLAELLVNSSFSATAFADGYYNTNNIEEIPAKFWIERGFEVPTDNVTIELTKKDIVLYSRESIIDYAKKDSRLRDWLFRHPDIDPDSYENAQIEIEFEKPFYIVKYEQWEPCEADCTIFLKSDRRNGEVVEVTKYGYPNLSITVLDASNKRSIDQALIELTNVVECPVDSNLEDCSPVFYLSGYTNEEGIANFYNYHYNLEEKFLDILYFNISISVHNFKTINKSYVDLSTNRQLTFELERLVYPSPELAQQAIDYAKKDKIVIEWLKKHPDAIINYDPRFFSLPSRFNVKFEDVECVKIYGAERECVIHVEVDGNTGEILGIWNTGTILGTQELEG